MELTFLGTKGEIEEHTKKHKYHSSLLLEYRNSKLLIDHGLESKPLTKTRPHNILITHGHPDHFIWLKENENYKGKIYLTRETKKKAKFKKNFEVINLNKWIKVGPFEIIPYRVIHSLIAPAVGFKIKNNKSIIYNPDLVVMKDKSVLNDVDLYIGDGSCFKANLVRRKDDKLFGHARMTTQINWCRKYNIKNIIFTHLGKEPLKIEDRKLEKKLNENLENNMNVRIARDGMELEI